MTDRHDNELEFNPAEAQLIADMIWTRAKNELYMNAGRGVLGLAWKGFRLLIVGLAVYGALKTGWFR